MTIRIVPCEPPVAEATIVLSIDDEGEQQTKVQRFNIVPIEDES